MARVLVTAVPPSAEVPASIRLLPHTIVSDAVELSDVDLVVLDGRSDLAAARQRCAELAAHGLPLLLVIDASALAVLTRDWGADDFVLDTATPGEVDARIRLLLTRPGEDGVITSGPVVIDESAYLVQVAGTNLDLTYTEFELFKYLALHPGRVLTREHLLSEVWGYDYYGGTRTVDVHVRRLRAKLGPEHDQLIGTVRNVGYRFQPTR